MKIGAGIVTYNPNILMLKKNINAVISQVDGVILFDNGSNNQADIIKVSNQIGKKIVVIPSRNNVGIAAAFNEIAKKLIQNHYAWLLTLDQDSVVKSGLITEYRKYLGKSNLGQLTCSYVDRNTGKIYNKANTEFEKITKCITSGALVSLKALKKIGGFNSELFIDSVDFELCYVLAQNNYETRRIRYIGMEHEVGNLRDISILGYKTSVYNESAFRQYYISRNQWILAKQFPDMVNKSKLILIQLLAIYKIMFYEKDKYKKSKNFLKGIVAGIKYKRKERKNYLGSSGERLK